MTCDAIWVLIMASIDRDMKVNAKCKPHFFGCSFRILYIDSLMDSVSTLTVFAMEILECWILFIIANKLKMSSFRCSLTHWLATWNPIIFFFFRTHSPSHHLAEFCLSHNQQQCARGPFQAAKGAIWDSSSLEICGFNCRKESGMSLPSKQRHSEMLIFKINWTVRPPLSGLAILGKVTHQQQCLEVYDTPLLLTFP